MQFPPGVYSELFRQTAFISALIAGFAFTFAGVLITNDSKRPIVGWTAAFSILASAVLVVCALGWTLSAPRMAALASGPGASSGIEMPDMYKQIHRCLWITFSAGFIFFLTSLGLSGWIRSRVLGAVSTIAAIMAGLLTIWVLSHFSR
jgi:Zn-dependent protease with chaperone function